MYFVFCSFPPTPVTSTSIHTPSLHHLLPLWQQAVGHHPRLDLLRIARGFRRREAAVGDHAPEPGDVALDEQDIVGRDHDVGAAREHMRAMPKDAVDVEASRALGIGEVQARSEEHTSELQSLMRISYAVFCLKKTNN